MSHPEGSSSIPSHFILEVNWNRLWPDGLLALYADSTLLAYCL